MPRLLFLFFLPQFIYAQPGSITGKLTGSDSLPVAFATVAALHLPDSAIAAGAVTDEQGNFSIAPLMPGKYGLKISAINYETKFSEAISVSAGNATVAPVIVVKKFVYSTDEIDITATKQFVQNTGEKKIYNTDQLPGGKSGSALDLLQQIPGVQSDMEGNLSMRGAGGIKILVDGKPSSLGEEGGKNQLEGLPAGSIESIEVITNPSARFDPDGAAGIINIVMRKDRTNGAGGNVTVSVGSRNKYTAGGNFTLRTKKIGFGAGLNGRSAPVINKSDFMRNYFLVDSTWNTHQLGTQKNYPASLAGRLSMDWYVSPHHTISFASNFGYSFAEQNEVIEYTNTDSTENLISTEQRTNDQVTRGNSGDYSVGWKHLYNKPGQIWSATATVNTSNTNRVITSDQDLLAADGNPLIPHLRERNTNENDFVLGSAQTDLSKPLMNKTKLEIGLKGSFRHVNNDLLGEDYEDSTDNWSNDPLITNHFLFDEKIGGGYFSLASSIRKFNFKCGVRIEQAMTTSKLTESGSEFENDYFSVFPSGSISRKFGKKADIALGYSRRINRPGISSLNPFPDYSDPYNLFYGNPFLKPEYVHAGELSGVFYPGNLTLTSTLYYRYTQQLMQRYRATNAEGISTITFQNINSSQATGVELSMNGDLKKWWTLSVNGNAFQTWLDATNIESGLLKQGFSWSLRANNSFHLPSYFEMQLTGAYSSPTYLPQGVFLAGYYADISLKKDVMHKQGNISFSLTDIFNTRAFRIQSTTTDVLFKATRKRESQIATLAFTLKIGKPDKKKPELDLKNPESGGEGF